MTPHDPDPDQRRVPARYRLGVAFLGVATVVASFIIFLPADSGGGGRAGIHPGWLIFVALWAGPIILHAALVRTAVGTVFGAVVLLAATGGFLSSILTSESSTAGIGLIGALVGGTYPLALAALGLDRVVEARADHDWSRLRSHLSVAAAVAGVFALVFAVTALSKLMNTTEGDHPIPLAGAVVGSIVVITSLVSRALLGGRTPTPGR